MVIPDDRITTDRIATLWEWCRAAYAAHGIALALPGRTDPRRTYQWRYLTALDRQLQQWGLDEALSRRLIDTVAAHARRHNLLRKGLSIFCQSNVLNLCYDRLGKQNESIEASLRVLGRTQEWLDRTHAGRDRVAVLLARSAPGAFTNIVAWYGAGRLTDVFLAMSRACSVAIAQLAKTAPEERALLPSAAQLMQLRTRLFNSPGVHDQAAAIMRDDLQPLTF